jgi:hypothetical protein
MANGDKSIKNKFFFSVMLFAFSWVIIGDLISFHIEIIYGNKLYDWHQPYTKTQKTDSKTIKVKYGKKDNSSKSLSLSFIAAKSLNITNSDFISSVFQIKTEKLTSTIINCFNNRAPPISLLRFL